MSSLVTVAATEAKPANALFAIPKKGRLHEQCLKLLEGAGLKYTRPHRLDVAHCSNFPVTLVFLPAADIASYVGEGNVDLGITGLDVLRESQVDVTIVKELGFGKCSLCVQAPTSSGFKSAKELSGKRIVTSFPILAKEFFDQYDTPENPTQIKFVSGSVEAACGLGLADAVVDLVETGTTMRAAGLEIVAEVLKTESLLIASKNSKHVEALELIKKRIEGYLTATNFMMIQYNVSRKNLAATVKVTPGKRSPTISPLEGDDEPAVAVSCLIPTKDSSDIMDRLVAVGATDILLLALSNSRM